MTLVSRDDVVAKILQKGEELSRDGDAGDVYIVSAPPGYGKSVLLNRVAREARATMAGLNVVSVDLRWTRPQTRSSLLLLIKAELESGGISCTLTDKVAIELARLEVKLDKAISKYPNFWSEAEKEARSTVVATAVDLATSAVSVSTPVPESLSRPVIKLLGDVADRALDRAVQIFSNRLLFSNALTTRERDLASRPEESLAEAMRADLAVETLLTPLIICVDAIEVVRELLPWLMAHLAVQSGEETGTVWVLAGQWLAGGPADSGASSTFELDTFKRDDIRDAVLQRYGTEPTEALTLKLEELSLGVPLLVDYLIETKEVNAAIQAGKALQPRLSTSVVGDALRSVVTDLVADLTPRERIVVTTLAVAADRYDSDLVRKSLSLNNIKDDELESVVSQVPLLRNGQLHDSVEGLLRTAILRRRGPLLSVQRDVLKAWRSTVYEAWRLEFTSQPDIFRLIATPRSRSLALRYVESELWVGESGGFNLVLELAIQCLARDNALVGSIIRMIANFWETERNVSDLQLNAVRVLATAIAGQVALDPPTLLWYEYDGAPASISDLRRAAVLLDLSPLTVSILQLFEYDLFIRRRFDPETCQPLLNCLAELNKEDEAKVGGYAGWLILRLLESNGCQFSLAERTDALTCAARLLHGQAAGLLIAAQIADSLALPEISVPAARRAIAEEPYSESLVFVAAEILVSNEYAEEALAAVGQALLSNSQSKLLLYEGTYTAVIVGAWGRAVQYSQRYYQVLEGLGDSGAAQAAAQVLFVASVAGAAGVVVELPRADLETAATASSRTAWTDIYLVVAKALVASELDWRAAWKEVGTISSNYLEHASEHDRPRFNVYRRVAACALTQEARVQDARAILDYAREEGLIEMSSILIPVLERISS